LKRLLLISKKNLKHRRETSVKLFKTRVHAMLNLIEQSRNWRNTRGSSRRPKSQNCLNQII